MAGKLVPITAVCTPNGVTMDTVNAGTECIKIVDFTVESLGNFNQGIVEQDVNVGLGSKQPKKDVYLSQQA